jgi:hypothetical protein
MYLENLVVMAHIFRLDLVSERFTLVYIVPCICRLWQMQREKTCKREVNGITTRGASITIIIHVGISEHH